MRKNIIFFYFIFLVKFLSAQQRNISGFYNNSLTFYPDTTYIIDFHTKIGSDATLKILPATKVLFASGASLIINGGLEIIGEPNNLVVFSSLDTNFQGIGLSIAGYKGSNVKVEYCKLSNLLIPLTFEDGWYRESVNIQNNIFTKISSQPGIRIANLSQIYSKATCNFNFLQNNFTDNNATIFIEPLEDDVLQINFSNNLISSNILIRKDFSNPLNAAFGGHFDQRNRQNTISFSHNSIFNNVMLSGITKEDVRELNFGINGAGESFEVSNNYWGNNKEASLIHFFQNDKLPLILLTNPLGAPSENTHAHIWKVRIKTNAEWQEVNNFWELPNFESDELYFELHYNREVTIPSNFTIPFQYYDDEKQKIEKITFQAKDVLYYNKVLTFNLQKLSKLKAMDNGVFIFPTATDNDGFNTPKFTLGNSRKVILFQQGQLANYLQEEKEKEDEKLVEIPLFIPKKITQKNKEISIGFLFGASLYAGDLSADFSNNSHLYFGMSAAYMVSDELFVTTEIATTKISGKSEGFKNLSFTSEIVEINLIASYQLKQFSLLGITPFVFLGTSIIHHQPMGNYQDFSFSLQELQTEGQDDPYNLNLISIPFGCGIQRNISKNFKIGIQARFRKVFSDYLDDVSEKYANYDDVLSNQGEVAAYFSDPSREDDNYDFQKNETRGNPFDKDTYSTILISISKAIK